MENVPASAIAHSMVIQKKTGEQFAQLQDLHIKMNAGRHAMIRR